MAITTAAPADQALLHARSDGRQASAVSWGAILAGAAAAAALSLILLILGTGLGLTAISPWTQAGISATTLGVSAIVWLGVTQVLASGMGGYLAGRLRARWIEVHRDEVYFRDTAHGFLAWAIASLATAALLSSTIASIVGTGVQAGASVAQGVAQASAAGAAVAAPAQAASPEGSSAEASHDPTGYFVDALFRRDLAVTAAAETPPSSVEVTRIFVQGLSDGALPPEDVRYLGQLVGQRTGLNQADAEKRVTDTFSRAQARLKDAETAARETADKARKASAYSALWLFISLLAGAFIASFTATLGGHQRDV